MTHRSLNRMLARDLFTARGLLLAVMSIIIIGVMCYVTMQTAYHNLQGAKQRYYTQCHMADFWLSLRKAPNSELRRLAELPGIAALQSRVSLLATADLPNFDPPITLQVVSLPRLETAKVNGILLRDGSWFSSDVAGEAIVSEMFAHAHRLQLGSTLKVLLNNRMRNLRIVGLAMGSEFTYALGPGAIMPDPERFGVCYVPQRFAEEAAGYQGAANEIVGRFSPQTAAQKKATLRQLEAKLEPYGRLSTTLLKDQTSNQFLTAELEGLGAFANVLPTIFLVVAALVLNVLIGRLVRQQRTTIGTLKAIGYGDTRLCVHYLMFGASVGLVGGLAGSLLGQWAGAGLTVIYRQYFELPDLRADFFPMLHARAIGASLLCAAAGSLQAVLHVLHLQPAAAMRPEPPQQGGRIWLERVTWFWTRLAAPWRLAVRSLTRHGYRTAAGVFASAMGAGLLGTGLMMLESQTYLINFEFFRVVRSDIDLVFDDVLTKDTMNELGKLPGVLLAEPQLQLSCEFRHGPYQRRASITGLLPGATLTKPHEGEFPIRLPQTGIVMGKRLADKLHVQVGDAIEVDVIRLRQPPKRVFVTRITDGFLGMSVYADIEVLSRLAEESWAMNAAQLRTDNSPDTTGRLFRRLKQMPAVQSVVSRRDMIRGLTETLLQNQKVFIGVIVVFSGSIFFGSILNASLVSLAERQREVGTMRALGYSPWRVGTMFLRESVLINMLGVALGIPVGYLLITLIARLYDSDLIRLPVVSAPWIPLATIVTGAAFTLLAHAVVQRVVHRMDWLEALKTKE